MKKIITTIVLITSLFGPSNPLFAFTVTGRILMHGSVNVYNSDHSISPDNFGSMYHKYKIQKRVTKARANLLKGGEYVLKTASTVGATMLSGGNPVAGALVGQVVGDSLSAIGNSIRTGMYEKMHNALDEGLKQTILLKSSTYLENMTGLPREKARRLITENPDIFNFHSRSDLQGGEKDLFQEAAIEVLADKLAGETLRNELQQLSIEANNEGIQKVKENMNTHVANFNAHLKSYKSFNLEINQKFTNIADSTHKIVKQVTKNTINISVNQYNITDIQGTLFTEMSGKEKLAALEKGWFAEKGESWVKDQFELATNQADIEFTMHAVAVTASNLPSALSLFTDDPKLLNAVNTASQIASGGLSILAASSMGPFGTAMATLGVMGSLFGKKGGADQAAAKRHEQVMEKFKAVIDNQIKISNQIDGVYKSLAEGQNEIYKVIQLNAQRLIHIGKRIEQIHFEQMKELHLIRSLTLANTDLLRDLSNRDPTSCQLMLGRKVGELSRLRVIDQFSTFEELETFFTAHKDLFRSCRSGLSYILNKHSLDDDIHSMLLTKSYADETNVSDVVWATQEVYTPVFHYYNQEKVDHTPNAYPDLIHTTALVNYVSLALEVYPMIMIVDDPDELTLVNYEKDLTLNRYSIQRAEELLKNSLALIDEAILQQEIIAGHGFLGNLVEQISASNDSVLKIERGKMIEANKILQENLVRKLVLDRAKKTESAIFYYNSLLSGNKAFPFFTKFFGDHFLPVKNEGKWNVDLKLLHEGHGPVLSLPDASDVIHDRWVYTADMAKLYEIREQVIEHLSLVRASGGREIY